MSSRRREQILENCRWLFDQEVQIITFVVRKYFKGTPNLNGNSSPGPYEHHYYAAVLPKKYSLKSLAKTDIEEKILLKEFHLLSSDGAISTLLETIEKRIGTVLEEDPDDCGRIRINPMELPSEIKDEEMDKLPTDIKHTTNKILSHPLASGEVPSGITVPSGIEGELPPGGAIQPDGLTTPISPAETAAAEGILKSYFEGLKKKHKKRDTSERVVSQGSEATAREVGRDVNEGLNGKPGNDISGNLSQLTKHNLSLLEKENTKAGAKENKVARLAPISPPENWRPQQKQNLFSAPEPNTASKAAPPASLKDDPENKPEPELVAPETSDQTPLPLQKITELEQKLHALDALVKTMQSGPYHSRELSTPTNASFPNMPNPIMTPTTSVASDSTTQSWRLSGHRETDLSDATREFIKAEIKSALEKEQPKRLKFWVPPSQRRQSGSEA